ncbi:MAG: glycosyltransferase family 2 protein [Candidatus Diapherotrites archaeon]|jgi:dolichol-phosphate hexosyltransferase|nr:glycosyltransferase family 2 protein [Candidatus Diapherotrites archaeon]MBT4596644.1 glycosyltransferase family 2 protein [Candidatus Diapherotrites archaeon]
MKNKISIIIPAYNEEEGIRDTVQQCKEVLSSGDEIIVVDDGSKDKTAEIAKKTRVRVVSYKNNKGKAGALKEGFKAAKNDILITIDADCTYPASKIPALVKKLASNDLVVGSRFRRMWPKDMPWHRVAANKLGAFVTSLILGETVTDVTTGLRAFKKDTIKGMNIKAKGLDFEAEFTAHAISKGYKYDEVKIVAHEREGNSSLRFFHDIWRFFKAVLRGKFSK